MANNQYVLSHYFSSFHETIYTGTKTFEQQLVLHWARANNSRSLPSMFFHILCHQQELPFG